MRIQLSVSDYGRRRTVEEIRALPTFSTHVAESVYRLNDSVYIDNVEGLGQTPDNQSVLYMGFLAQLSTKTFADLALLSYDREMRAKNIGQAIHDGMGIGCPCLYINIDPYIKEEDGVAEIVGHEGRARCAALNIFGIHELPIQFIIRGYRARRVKDHEDFRQWLNTGLISEGGILHKNVFDTPLIFW